MMGKKSGKKLSMVIICVLALLVGMNAGYAETPKRGGEMVTGYGQFPNHFNHAIQSGAATASPGTQIFALLVEINEQFQPIPYLAKSWEVSDDHLTYTFHMVEGATFHDGKPITSEDVAFLETVKANHPFGLAMLGPVDRVETPDKYTAVFKLSKPHPALMLVVSPPLLPILPKHVYGDGQPIRQHPANTKPVGSGPFKLAEYKPGEYFILERYENFFRPGLPYLDRIIGRAIKDPNANFIALKNEDFHMAMFNAGIRLSQIEALKKLITSWFHQRVTRPSGPSIFLNSISARTRSRMFGFDGPSPTPSTKTSLLKSSIAAILKRPPDLYTAPFNGIPTR